MTGALRMYDLAADHIVCAAFQWIGMVSRDAALEETDPLVGWRSQVLERFEAKSGRLGP
jgi:hypothetical protein